MNSENKTMVWALIIVVVIGLALAVFFITQNKTPVQSTNTTTTNTTTNNTAEEKKVAVGESKSFILSEQNSSGQSGTVVLEEVGNQVQVVITLANPTASAEPAHIHVGSCPAPGAVVFGLSDVVNGASVTLLDTTLAELKTKGALAVNIHKSAAESTVYYSCGNLAL